MQPLVGLNKQGERFIKNIGSAYNTGSHRDIHKSLLPSSSGLPYLEALLSFFRKNEGSRLVYEGIW